MKNLILTLFLLCSLSAFCQDAYTLDSTELTSRVVKDSLDIPWEIIWGPDDHIWVTERFGRVSRIEPKTGKTEVLLDMSADVYERAEAGMLGMVLHPDFENHPQVFIAYTYQTGSSIRERLVRFNYTGGILVPADTLIEQILGNTTHVGCRLLILPDNTLLMTTGDAQRQSLPLDTNSVVGKVLRMNLDGTIPNDNPYSNSYVWSIGHRNAQGLWRAPNGIIYSSEHGPTTDDELNILRKKGNYGWPTVAGFCDSPPEDSYCSQNAVEEPLAAWTPTIAPSDIIWYDHEAIPEFKDKLLMTVLKDKSLIAFSFNGTGDSVISQEKYFKNEFGRLRDVCVSPSGKIYLATNGNGWSNTNPFTHSIIELSNEKYSHVKEVSPLSVSLYPNPVKVGGNVKFTLLKHEKAVLTIYDAFGRICSKEVFESRFSIELSFLPGLYNWKLVLENGEVASGKLVLE